MISIIVCTYNRELYLPKMLNSVAKQNCNRDDFELIIVDNNSTDNTSQICKNFESSNINIYYFLEKKQGLSFARNRGIKEAKGNFLVFIDDDAFLDKCYINELKKYLANIDGDVGFGGKILPYLECELPKWMSDYLSPLMSIIDLGNKIKLFKGYKYPIGANMGVSKSIISKIGTFNEKLGRTGKSMMGGEEKDFFHRIKKSKIPIYYFPKMLVNHVIPSERLTVQFIRTQALGIGRSEYIRVKNDGILAVFKKINQELVKWVISFLLLFWHLLTFKFQKGWMIIRFRCWVSIGILQGLINR